jgi:hypothetical protein
MNMTRTIEKTVFAFDELSDRAKESAREWYREGNLDYEWWDCVYEDAAQCGKILGIDLMTRTAKLMGGGTRMEPNIYFSGFCSQGDGACFQGSYSYAKGATKAIREYAPDDKDLHAIADGLQEMQRKAFYRIEAQVKHRGHYYHEMCTEIDVTDSRTGNYVGGDTEDACVELLRDFMRWIYKRLESEHDYLQSNESVDESIRANEYEFDEDGKPA